MDIAAPSIALSTSRVQQATSFALMKETMDHTQQGANSLISMMSSESTKAVQHAAQPHLGSHVDVSG
ncbi:YjfB family protein [Jeotgalibacillus haloalkalitolerans]|uniref:YjfB family protein n=1 Tax=Jeotgalibacillus haloalkalitolerans TaxID=3104292 RepID=A0ABU5KJQ0_9BACL|nr:YjfB family protein [Jeotgalibacillus sp. HH7-29]MDZ5711487.1 YjfB family protein [Jeotgalibacillus sp. HH7-29]